MKERKTKGIHFFTPAVCFLILFILYTVSLMSFDRRPIGPQNSPVGFAAINAPIHELLGVNMRLYYITDWLSLVPVVIVMGFGLLGMVQLVKRRSILRVDRSILILGGFYLLVFCAYLFFEFYVVNHRPILINGVLEASYPSSTTMLAMCIMPAAMMQFHSLIQNQAVRKGINILCGFYTAFMVIGRLLSGVHWFTDIMGGMILSAALVMLYHGTIQLSASKS
ncbi:phosphatase PAP2 family protein [Diplocloster hominis]|uniref:phosphatase PAP2 family protein n=1 Tax=Diplocloster hominis TaxID=3079010 RepID=UPI0031BBBA77